MKVSVCMATYNGEKYIKEQIDSILTQLSKSDEVIISDDHSKDNTIRIIESIGDSRIKIFYNESIRGYTNNFENALKKSQGEIIFLSDQDDVWIKNKVSLMLQKLKNYDLVISDATYVNEKLERTRGSHFELANMKSGFFRHLIKPSYIGACMAFNRKVLEKALPFPHNTRLCAHDYWLTLIGEFFFRVGLVNNELLLYRRHDLNASAAGMKSPNSLLKKVSMRVYSFFQLLMRFF